MKVHVSAIKILKPFSVAPPLYVGESDFYRWTRECSRFMSGFTSGRELLLSSCNSLSTGSQQLDMLVGGIQRGMFYLFYGEEPLIEALFQYLIANALKPTDRWGSPVVVYMLCGNYRRERTELGTEALVELLESSGYGMEEALRRVRILTASSADQQALLVGELLNILEAEPDVSLVLVRGIFKLHHDDARIRNRHVVREEVQRSITRFSQLCAERNIPVVASGRPRQGKLLPRAESSSFLRHIANAVVYLRRRRKGSKYNRAFLLSHPARVLGSTEYAYEVNEELGRDTPPFRQSFHGLVSRLRREFQDALISVERREAFDYLVGAWSAELGAMSFAESVKLLDLLFLVAVVENRSFSESLSARIRSLEERIRRVEEQIELR